MRETNKTVINLSLGIFIRLIIRFSNIHTYVLFSHFQIMIIANKRLHKKALNTYIYYYGTLQPDSTGKIHKEFIAARYQTTAAGDKISYLFCIFHLG